MEKHAHQRRTREFLLVLLVALASCLLAGGTPIAHQGRHTGFATHVPTRPTHADHHTPALATSGRLVIHDSHAENDEPIVTSHGRVATWSKLELSTPPPTQRVPATVVHDTKTAILLTNGQQIKLYPLRDNDLIPSGGYYVIKSLEQFNISDSKVIKTLGPESPFTRWLEHKQSQIKLKLSENQTLSSYRGATFSILPHGSKRSSELNAKQATLDLVDDEDLFLSNNSSGWKRPLITGVGHMFDDRLCPGAHGQNCFVVFWTDKRNKLLRYGAHQFTPTNRIELLSSKFNVHGNLKSLSDDNKKTIWLYEFPPVDLCQQVRHLRAVGPMVECEVASVLWSRQDRSIRVDLRLGIGNMRPIFRWIRSSLEHTDIGISYHIHAKGEIVDPPIAIKTQQSCLIYKFSANHELYSWDPSSNHIEIVKKMSSKPVIREPGEVQLHRDTLFFNDLAARTIMSTNITRKKELGRREQQPDQAKNPRDKIRFGTIQKLDLTHQVLLVEPSTVESFNIVNFDVNWRDPICSHSETEASLEPRVIDDDLSENMTRRKIDRPISDYLVFAGGLMYLILFVLFICIVPPKLFKLCRDCQAIAKLDGRYNEIQT